MILGFGLNDDGQCGTLQKDSDEIDSYLKEGSPLSYNSPIKIKLNETLKRQGLELSYVNFPFKIQIILVTAGSRHSLALTKIGEVYSWGWGLLGQLGLGNYNTTYYPTKIEELNIPIITISAGGMHSACIDINNECYSWGSSQYGQLGLGDEIVKESKLNIPNKIKKDDGSQFLIKTISCGGMHTAAVDLNGKVWCWGRADSGQAGSGHWIYNFFSGIVYPHHVSDLPNDDPASQAICGAFHTVVILRSGRVITFGKEDFGMLGTGNGNGSIPTLIDTLLHEVVIGASCGGWHTLLWTESGNLYACGKGEYGRLGLGHESSCTEPIRVILPFQKSSSSSSDLNLDSNIKVVSAAAGGSHSMVLDSTGVVWAVGRTDDGRLGFAPLPRRDENSKTDRLCVWTKVDLTRTINNDRYVTQIAAGGSHSFILLSDD